jgi:ADP-heptose:LPS heptosyltransferase
VAVSPPDLAVLRALGLGDLLTAVPALRALAAAFDGRRVLLGPVELAAIAEPLGFEVLDAHGTRTVPRSLPRAAAGAGLAVNLHGRGPQSHRVLGALRPERMLAYACAGHAGPVWDEEEHEVARWCRLVAEEGIEADPDDLAIEVPDVPPHPRAVGATIVHPGATSGARRWPIERWAHVIAAELRAGREVVITGSPDERLRARLLAVGCGLPEDAVLAGRTSVAELVATVAAAERLVCGDTGVAHLATAHGTPSVVLFGPVSPARWGPLPGGPHRVLWAGRTGDPHGDRLDPGLAVITAEQVLGALDALPARDLEAVAG